MGLVIVNFIKFINDIHFNLIFEIIEILEHQMFIII